ncbi:MAG: hypothetical protein ACTSQN_09275, partial [Candidatus Heimdallarchaeota archaeon]
LPIAFILIIVLSSYSVANLKGTAVPDNDFVLTTSATYNSDYYVEGIDLFPLRGTAVGVNTAMVGGETELPFDLTPYNNLQVFNLIAANQRAWQLYSMRRFWDVPDGVAMMLVFRQQSADQSLDDAKEIKDMIQAVYGIRLTLVYGQYQSDGQVTQLVFLGDFVGNNDLSNFIGNFTTYTANDGFGAGITYDLLNDAPVKSMSVSVIHGRFPFLGAPTLDWIPVLECSWIDPDGLNQTNTVIDLNLIDIMPDLGTISGASYSNASFVTMELPYIVDVLEIDPPTDNMYPHLNRRFEWVIEFNVDSLPYSISHDYADIHVKYDLNLTGLQYFPQVIGEMSIDNTLPITGGEDIEYSFFFENIGNEEAYNISLAYGDFNNDTINGMTMPVIKSNLSFNQTQVMFFNTTSELFTSTPMAPGPDVVSLQGWFYDNDTLDWYYNDQIVPGADFDLIFDLIYEDETFLQLEQGDFTLTNYTNDVWTLETTIDSLAPGENITKRFSIDNLPSGSYTFYNEPVEMVPGEYLMTPNVTIDWEEYLTIFLRLLGSTLHIPEDQQTITNLFPVPVVGSAFYYEDINEKEYMGMTNGLVYQVYDNEAVVIGKLSLDPSALGNKVYRFDEQVNYTLELTNIGDTDAIDIDYMLWHAFVSDTHDVEYVHPILGTNGTVAVLHPDETVKIPITSSARTRIGLHPVFAIFGYTSDEPEIDPRDNATNIPDKLKEILLEAFENNPVLLLLALIDAYNEPIFSTVEHPAVFSSMDFGIVIPPLNKEGRLEPTYPTPEVEVVTELIYDGNLIKGDEIVLRSSVTNVGDEPTNIIFIQRIPHELTPLENTLTVTIEGIPYYDFDVGWYPKSNLNMGVGIVADNIIGPRDVEGFPLGVNETVVVEVTLRVNTDNVDYVFIPPTEIRYRSEFDMTETNGINEDVSAPETEAAMMSSAAINFVDNTINPDATSVPTDTASTNSWGAYANSLSLVLDSIAGLNLNFIYIGVGLIAVTGVAVLIYFRANGKKH